MQHGVDVVVVGAGPAGLFCAERLLDAGLSVAVAEAGKPLTSRKCPESVVCGCETCAVLEGVGGAGGFSDGKKTYSLTRGTQLENFFAPELEPFLKEIDETIVQYSPFPGVWVEPPGVLPEFAAGSGFEFSAYPLRHIGTDGVRGFIAEYVAYLREFPRFALWPSSPVTAIERIGGGYLTCFGSGDAVWSRRVVIATGLAGWAWVEGLMSKWGIPVSTGPASIGMRYEAPMDRLEPLFSWFYDFKIVRGRLRSFCANRGGRVISENHRRSGIVSVNGDSYLRDRSQRTRFSNFAILAKLASTETDCVEDARSAALAINRLEGRSGGPGTATTKVQRASDFLDGVATRCRPLGTHSQSVYGCDIGLGLSGGVREEFRSYIRALEDMLGIPAGVGTLYAPEIKYAGYRVPVDTSTFRLRGAGDGCYVIGNATGSLDSFVSAALTGIVAARDIVSAK